MTRIFALLFLTVLAAPAAAADLKVISAGSVRGLMAGMIEDYSARTGHKFEVTVGTTGQLRAIIASEQPADLIITSSTLMAELEKTGKLTPGSRTDLGRVGIGVAIRENAAAPDISTAEAFKKVLIEVRSVSYTDPAEGGTSGLYVVRLLDRFGIADAVKPKSVLTKGGRETVLEVVQGSAEIGIAFISEIVAVKGAKVAAAVPDAVQDYTVYAAAIPLSSADPANARAFIAALSSSAMAERWRAAGFEPPK